MRIPMQRTKKGKETSDGRSMVLPVAGSWQGWSGSGMPSGWPGWPGGTGIGPPHLDGQAQRPGLRCPPGRLPVWWRGQVCYSQSCSLGGVSSVRVEVYYGIFSDAMYPPPPPFHTHMCTHTHNTHTHTYIHTQMQTHTHEEVHPHACMHACAHARTHTYTHTHSHAHAHTPHTHIQRWIWRLRDECRNNHNTWKHIPYHPHNRSNPPLVSSKTTERWKKKNTKRSIHLSRGLRQSTDGVGKVAHVFTEVVQLSFLGMIGDAGHGITQSLPNIHTQGWSLDRRSYNVHRIYMTMAHIKGSTHFWQ